MVANIKYRACLSDDENGRRVEVRLESLGDIAHRKGEGTTSSPSVTAYLAPNIGQEVNKSKGSTMIYKVEVLQLTTPLFHGLKSGSVVDKWIKLKPQIKMLFL